ncbi:MAG TPA: glycosyltransferase family 39 protein [Bacteroidales bacterium]|jgi:4-amino-4-deoxy-L-arabinose transferase-like glycosyltransferase|nr:glycosyltransferase family 39 protein [Bacteroidales bacterium]
MPENSKGPSLYRHYGIIVLLFIIACFFIVKIVYLKLPFYWDEAWSYAVAVFDMDVHGLALLPGDGNIELTRGHPLLFYFLSAIWIKLFGHEVSTIHLLPLIISCSLILTIYIITRAFSDVLGALTTSVFLILQSIFFVQSSLLLPEVMLTLWIILVLIAYLNKRWNIYLLCSILLILTKESGIVLIIALLIDKIVLDYLFKNEINSGTPERIKELLIMIVPVIVFGILLIVQKIRLGWFLYPDHLKMMDLNVQSIKYNFILIKDILFQGGRAYLFMASFICITLLTMKESITKFQARFISLCWVYIIIYLIFCSMNFFATRYLLSAVAVLIIVCTWPVLVFLRNLWLKIAFILVFVFIFTYHTFLGPKNAFDTSIGFKNAALLQKKAVQFAEEMKLHRNKIYSTFLMQYYMGIPELSYLADPLKPFIIKNTSDIDYDVYIFCSNEKDQLYDQIKNDPDIKLLKRFQNNEAWIEFYIKSALH